MGEGLRRAAYGQQMCACGMAQRRQEEQAVGSRATGRSGAPRISQAQGDHAVCGGLHDCLVDVGAEAVPAAARKGSWGPGREAVDRRGGGSNLSRFCTDD
jgi:hypothetical protein